MLTYYGGLVASTGQMGFRSILNINAKAPRSLVQKVLRILGYMGSGNRAETLYGLLIEDCKIMAKFYFPLEVD